MQSASRGAVSVINEDSWWDRLSARYRLSQKMLLLMGLITLGVVATNAFNGLETRESIREVIDTGLESQVDSYQKLLQQFYDQDPAHFLQKSRQVLETARWGEDNSDYLFLTKSSGELAIYPPNKSREGGFADPVALEGRSKNLNQGLAEIGQTKTPTLMRYRYQKPGGGKVLKDVYVVPVGPYLLAGGVYLDAADKQMHQLLVRSLLALACSLALLGLWIMSLNKAIKVRVKRVMTGLARISERDLSQSALLHGKDEFAEVARGLETTRLALSDVLNAQRTSAVTLASTSTQMDNGMVQVSAAVVSQRQRLETLASALEQMASSTQEVAKNAQASATDTQHTARMVAEGMTTLDGIISAVHRLSEDMNSTASAVDEVEQGVSEIGKLASAINGIAEQTNLLALNAAIEAARAGEQGRGFAVVADEVRQLAGHSQRTTQDIANVINSLTGHTGQAVTMMHGAVKAAEQTMAEVEAARSEFNAINDKATLIADHSTQIAAASEEQSLVTEEVSQNLIGIRDAVEETETVVNELHSASSSLKGEAQNMEQLVESYRLER
ncbi:methyl-accepting chemotaxis protein [Gallaecimonas mangrovi]|uniref:methyl-accepting chemotaxis protein n=1 Tax=Gallaecimonas mangrovi TaxID=2291597 RepID=UPI000E201121|nr:methyl-accepting chemotaxis protein [Gallaecimonas mangrovi]